VLEARFVDLLTRLADSAEPLDGVAAWVDAHPAVFQHDGGASFRVRTDVQAALAVCWLRRLEHITEANARTRLRLIAQRPADGCLAALTARPGRHEGRLGTAR